MDAIVASLSIPGLPAGAFQAVAAFAGLAMILLGLRLRGRLNVLLDDSPTRETVVAVLRSGSRAQLLPLTPGDLSPVAIHDGGLLPNGETAVVRWREGRFRSTWIAAALPTGLPADPDDIVFAYEAAGLARDADWTDDVAAAAFAAAGREADPAPEDGAPGPAGVARRPCRTDFPLVPFWPPLRRTHTAAMVNALLLAASLAACLSAANAGFDPAAGAAVPVRLAAIVPGPGGLYRTLRLEPLAGGRRVTTVPFFTALPATGAVFLAGLRPGLFRVPWIDSLRPLPADAPAALPGKPEARAGANVVPRGLLRDAWSLKDPRAARKLIDDLAARGDTRPAFDLAEAASLVFPDDADLLLLAIGLAERCGEPEQVGILLARGRAARPGDARFAGGTK